VNSKEQRNRAKGLPESQHVPQVIAILDILSMRLRDYRSRLETCSAADMSNLQGHVAEIHDLIELITKVPKPQTNS
jgi:hypothetical protein